MNERSWNCSLIIKLQRLWSHVSFLQACQLYRNCCFSREFLRWYPLASASYVDMCLVLSLGNFLSWSSLHDGAKTATIQQLDWTFSVAISCGCLSQAKMLLHWTNWDFSPIERLAIRQTAANIRCACASKQRSTVCYHKVAFQSIDIQFRLLVVIVFC